jgi:hypothetical protein
MLRLAGGGASRPAKGDVLRLGSSGQRDRAGWWQPGGRQQCRGWQRCKGSRAKNLKSHMTVGGMGME